MITKQPKNEKLVLTKIINTETGPNLALDRFTYSNNKLSNTLACKGHNIHWLQLSCILLITHSDLIMSL